MINQNEPNKNVALFKNGNSYAFRVSKKDREFMDVHEDTQFKKILADDGTSITFKKVEKRRPNVLEIANKLYDEHSDLMTRLSKL